MEVWKTVDGVRGLYEVSNLGRYRRSERPDAILKPFVSKFGYPTATLSVKGVNIKKHIHRMVIETFNPTEDDTLEVNHIDGDKTNNSLENLEWVTKSENHLHRHSLNDAGRGERCNLAKLTDSDIPLIRKKYNQGVSSKEIATEFGVTYKTIWRIVTNQTWTHVKAS